MARSTPLRNGPAARMSRVGIQNDPACAWVMRKRQARRRVAREDARREIRVVVMRVGGCGRVVAHLT